MAGGVIHAVGIVFQKQFHLNTVFLGETSRSPIRVEAHRHASGAVSLRVTSSAALAGGQVSFDGAAARGEVKLPLVADYCVSEVTIANSEAGASTTGSAEVRFIARSAEGSTLAEAVAPIV